MFDYTWLIAVAAIIGTLANARKKRWGFAVWIVTNSFWCVYDLYFGLYSQSFLYLVFMLISAYGLYNWSKKPAEQVAKPTAEQKTRCVYIFVGMFQGIVDEVETYWNEKDAEAKWSDYTGAVYSEFEDDDDLLGGTKYEGSTIYISDLKEGAK